MEIVIKPLERRVSAPTGSNLLDVMRENGVPVSHSCMAGRCGTCRCKVLSGEVREHAPAETRPANAGTPQGRYVLACQTTVSGDCVIEVPEPDEVVVHPARTLKGTVTAFEPLCHDVRMLRLRSSKPLEFSPGQYTQLQFAPNVARPYSLAGVTGDDELEYHIRIVPRGRVTQYIESKVQVGDSVKISGPLGTSYLRRRHDGPMLCVAGGTGLAPMLSIARGALEGGMSNPIHFYFGARAQRDVYGEERLAALAERHPNFHYEIVLSAPEDRSRYRHGLVTEAVTESLPRLQGWRAYLAGPPVMVEAASLLAIQRGVAPEHVYADAFYATGI